MMFTFRSMMMTCDCTCKSSVGFTFSSLLMGVFVCAILHILWKIIILLLKGMLIRDCDWDSCNMEEEVVNVEHFYLKNKQNAVGEIARNIDYDGGVLQKGVEELMQLEHGSVEGFHGFAEILQFDDQCKEGFKQYQVEEISQFDDQCAGVGEMVHHIDFDGGVLQKCVEKVLQLEDESVRGFNGFAEILQFDDRCVEVSKKEQAEEILQSDDQCAGVVEMVHHIDHDGGVLQKRVYEVLQLEDEIVRGFNGFAEILQFDDQCVEGSKKEEAEEILQFDDQCDGVGEMVHHIDHDGGVLQKGVEEFLQLEDEIVRGFNGFAEILQSDDQCVEGSKKEQVEEISQFHDQCRESFTKNGVEEIFLSNNQCDGGSKQDEFGQSDDQCVGGFEHNGIEEIWQLDDQCIRGFGKSGFQKKLQLDDQCVEVGGFKQNGSEKILQRDDQCVGAFQQNGLEKSLHHFEHNDDQSVGGLKLFRFEKLWQLHDQCVGGFKLNGFEKCLQFDNHSVGAFEPNDDQGDGGYKQNGSEKTFQLYDRCMEGFKQNGCEKILQLHDHCTGSFEHNDDQCAEGYSQNGFEEVLQLDDQCVGGFSQEGPEDIVTHLENNDEDQHISQFKEDNCVEDQELIAMVNSEANVDVLDESCKVEVSSDGEAGSEEVISCVEQNALITSRTSTTKEEELEVNGFAFGTDHDVEDRLDSPKDEEEGLENPTSEDIVGQIEDMAAVNNDTIAREHLNTEFEGNKLSETSIEHNSLLEILDINAIEGTYMIGERCGIEEKKNALDKMLEELESKELEDLCKVPNNDKQIYELMHDLSKDEGVENHVCEIVEDDKSDFSSERKNPDHIKVADRIRDLKHDLFRLQYESVSEESTSKSSGSDQQRISTMSRQSESEDYWYNQPAEAPPSPGHGGSTARSIDALYETYTERMRHFDRINNYQMHSVGMFEPKFFQKSRSLKLTSSFRQLSSRREVENDEIDYKLQKEELENVYVAQTCLTWEALHWQYKIVRYLETSSSIDGEASLSYDQAAEQFRQFQVLLQRFLENEHYNQGARIQEYSRSRSLMPKLLQVPSLRASSSQREEEEEEIHEAIYRNPVTISQLIKIMEEAIMTFWDFVKADKDVKICRSSKHQKQLMDSTDSALLHAIKRCLEKKESRLNDLKRRGKFLRKNKSNPRRAEETEILLALIDLRIITRVLSMSRVSKDHLRWCEEKLNALNISQNGLHRDYMPLYFPS